jgi:hypothetical protein
MIYQHSLALYAQAGRMAAEAINAGDLERWHFYRDWAYAALKLETTEWSRLGRQTFEAAYRNVRHP